MRIADLISPAVRGELRVLCGRCKECGGDNGWKLHKTGVSLCDACEERLADEMETGGKFGYFGMREEKGE